MWRVELLRRVRLEGELLGGLPEEVGVVAAEVTVVGGLLVDGPPELESVDDLAGAKVEVGLDDGEEILVGAATLGGTVGVDEDGEGVRDTDGVRDLHEGAVGEAGGDERLGDPPGGVGSRAIDLGGVLAGEGTTTVGAPTTIGIDDDLTASETGVTLGTTDDEPAGGVEMVDGLVVEKVGGDAGLDDLPHEALADLVVGHVLIVLDGDDDGVDAEGDEGAVLVPVLDGHLGLGVGAHPGEEALVPGLGHPLAEAGGKDVGHGHELGGLVGGIAEHVALITGTEVVIGTADVHTLSNVGALLLDGNEDVAGLVVETCE